MTSVTMFTTYTLEMFLAWLPPGCSHGASRYTVYVSNLKLLCRKVSWYVASTLCCYSWVFTLSDTLPLQSYLSKVWFLCVVLLVSYRSIFLHELGGWQGVCLSVAFTFIGCSFWWLDMIWCIGVIINCKTRWFLFWSGFCLAESYSA